MTPTQKKILNYILKHHEKHNAVPTSGYVAKHFKISRQAVNLHYHALVKLGWIRKLPIQIHYELSTDDTLTATT